MQARPRCGREVSRGEDHERLEPNSVGARLGPGRTIRGEERDPVFSPLTVLLLVVIGGAIGFLSGLLGMGGGSLMIPALVVIFDATGLGPDLSTRMSFGTNLLVGTVTALIGFLVHRRYQTGLWSIVLPLASTSVLGALCGSTVASHLPGSLLRLLFGAAVAVVAVSLLLRTEHIPEGEPTFSVAFLLPLGFFIGFTASLVGLGGAVFTTIILVAILKHPMQRVVGISTFVQTAGALSGAVGYMLNGLGRADLPPYSVGYVNLFAAAAMMVSGLPLAGVGARLTHRMRSQALRRVFGGVLLAISAAMIWSGIR